MVLGGASLLGSRLVTHLTKSEQLFKIFDLVGSEEIPSFQSVDIENVDSLSNLSWSGAIINLAAVHRDDIRPLSRYDDVNTQASVNVCEAALKHDVNKIMKSSVAIYGFTQADTGESGEQNYFNDYGRTKYLAE